MSEMTLEKFKKPTLKVGKSSDSSLYSRRLRKMKFENVNNFIYWSSAWFRFVKQYSHTTL